MLKRFSNFKMNESVENESEELKQFTENSLVYLMDEGLRVSIDMFFRTHMPNNRNGFSIILTTSAGVPIKWGDMKDDILPFLTMLNYKYPIDNMKLLYVPNGLTITKLDDIDMESLENFESDNNIFQLVIEVKIK